MKICDGVEVQSHLFLSWVLNGDEWTSFTLQLPQPVKKESFWRPLNIRLGEPSNLAWTLRRRDEFPAAAGVRIAIIRRCSPYHRVRAD